MYSRTYLAWCVLPLQTHLQIQQGPTISNLGALWEVL